MITLSNNPLIPYIPINHGVIKTVSVSMPDRCALYRCHIQITWDEGANMRCPELDIDDTSSPDAIINNCKAVKVRGWSRRANTEITATLQEEILPGDIERWLSEIGWALGAGYMYRWHTAPNTGSMPYWAFGADRYTVAGMDTAYGDNNADLAQEAYTHGFWQWEINAAYNKQQGNSSLFWDEWYRCDVSLDSDGSRSTQWLGWDGHCPMLTADPQSCTEAQYFYSPTFSGRGKNKKMKKIKHACYAKQIQWTTRDISK